MRTASTLLMLLSLGCRGAGEDVDGFDDGTDPIDSGSAADPLDDPLLGAEALTTHLQALHDLAMAHDGNRAVGTSGYEASVVYVEGVLADLGYATRREPFTVGDWSARALSLTVDGTGVGGQLFTWSPGGDVTGEVVAVDVVVPPTEDPSSTSGCEPADFAAFPTGAVALIQRGTCTFAEKVANAEAAGASAVLIFNEGQRGRTGVVEGTLDEADPPAIPVVGLSYDDGAALVASGGTATLSAEVDLEGVPSVNLLADLEGTSGSRWIVGAHLDSVPAGPGINDNGTGVATLLQLAARLAARDEAPRHGVRFAFWGAEEVGLVGSLHHARQMSEDDVAATLGNLNFDMVGSPNPARFVYDGDESDFPSSLDLHPHTALLEHRFLDHFDGLGLDHAPTAFAGRTDYLGFALLGLPVAGTFTGAEGLKTPALADAFGGAVGEPFDACYHRDCDTVGNLDPVMMEGMATAAATVLDQVLAEDLDTAMARRSPGRVAFPAALPARVARVCHGPDPVADR